MLQSTAATRLELYRASKAEFERRRRAIRADFDTLYSQFTGELSSAEIARRAGVSRARIRVIFDRYFSDLLGTSILERRQKRARELNENAAHRLVRAITRDRVLSAIFRSADRAKRKRRIEPIISRRSRDPSKCFRHRAVLVDGREVEPVHHIRNAQRFSPGGIAYATTSLSRKSLEEAQWIIFCIDVASHRRRVLRCRCADLLKALFSAGDRRRQAYIPLDRRPDNPRYDFLADEDNWS